MLSLYTYALLASNCLKKISSSWRNNAKCQKENELFKENNREKNYASKICISFETLSNTFRIL